VVVVVQDNVILQKGRVAAEMETVDEVHPLRLFIS
jgi:hypothetical protein